MGKDKVVRKIILSIFVISVLIFPIIFFNKINIGTNIWFDSNSSKLEILYYISQIISSILLVISLIFAVSQYYLELRSKRRSVDLEQIQKAIDLSEYYKDHILRKYIPIKYIFETSGVMDIINDIKESNIKDFDRRELYELLGTKKIDELKKIQYSDRFVKAIIEANDIYKLDLNIRFKKAEIEKEGKVNKVIQVETQSIMRCFLADIISSMLNDMEFFSMHFTHTTAEQSVVYQSLSPSYLEIVYYLYYYIADGNEPTQPYFYTNVTELYLLWREQNKKQSKEALEGARNAKYKGKSVKDLKVS